MSETLFWRIIRFLRRMCKIYIHVWHCKEFWLSNGYLVLLSMGLQVKHSYKSRITLNFMAVACLGILYLIMDGLQEILNLFVLVHVV